MFFFHCWYSTIIFLLQFLNTKANTQLFVQASFLFVIFFQCKSNRVAPNWEAGFLNWEAGKTDRRKGWDGEGERVSGWGPLQPSISLSLPIFLPLLSNMRAFSLPPYSLSQTQHTHKHKHTPMHTIKQNLIPSLIVLLFYLFFTSFSTLFYFSCFPLNKC